MRKLLWTLELGWMGERGAAGRARGSALRLKHLGLSHRIARLRRRNVIGGFALFHALHCPTLFLLSLTPTARREHPTPPAYPATPNTPPAQHGRPRCARPVSGRAARADKSQGASPRELILEACRRNNTDLLEETIADLASAASKAGTPPAAHVAQVLNEARDGVGNGCLHVAATFGSCAHPPTHRTWHELTRRRRNPRHPARPGGSGDRAHGPSRGRHAAAQGGPVRQLARAARLARGLGHSRYPARRRLRPADTQQGQAEAGGAG